MHGQQNINVRFPLIAILDAAIPIFIFNFFMSFLMSSSQLFFRLPYVHIDISFQLYTFFTILSFAIRCQWPNQLNRCVFMRFNIYLCLINSSNSSSDSIFRDQFFLLQGQRSFLKLSFQVQLTCFYGSSPDTHFTATCYCWTYDTPVLFFMIPPQTHTSQPHVTVGLMILQYCFLWFFPRQTLHSHMLLLVL